MKNCFREKLTNKQPIMATRINSTWPMVAEVVGATGLYDYVEFLGEYAPYSQVDLENIARACELHDMSCIIKVDYANRAYVAQKALASGFQGILFTDHTTAKEVEDTLKNVIPATPQLQGRLGFVNAVKNIEEICQVPGVDFIQFGPADFSMNSGFNAKEEVEKVREAEEKVIRTALKYGVSPRVELNSSDEAERYIKMGVTHFALGSELRIERVYWTEQGNDLLEQLGQQK